MIKQIITDPKQLSTKCKPCFFNQLEELKNKRIVQDLIDTARHHVDECIGLAANQIGHGKRIITVRINNAFQVMVNPVILPKKTAGVKAWQESCLSFPGKKTRKRRYKKIKVRFQLVTGLSLETELSGLEAVIVQHEVDHLNGILI